jgi:hypothetical protein
MRCVLLGFLCVMAASSASAQTASLIDYAREAAVQASCAAGAPDAKYGINSATDGNPSTWWASSANPRYPVQISLRFPRPVTVDTLLLTQGNPLPIYSWIKRLRVESPGVAPVVLDLADAGGAQVFRFPARQTDVLTLSLLEPYDASRIYVTVSQLSLYHDPDQKVKIKVPPTLTWRSADLRPQGRAQHPCVYMTPEDVAAGRQRVQTVPWAQKWFAQVLAEADRWVAKDDAWFANLLPEQGACFAYGFTGCPICGASWGTWGGARCSFDKPRQVTCGKGHVLPDKDHPDPGTGYVGPDGRIHYFVGSYNAWIVEQFQSTVLRPLTLAYTLTGQEKYAQKAAFLLDRLADLYPTCDKGSWDYPSNPPSGRFCRPWYQVARVLIYYVDWYDQLFNSPALDQPSVRTGMSRRQNIETNLLTNGAKYCYDQSLHGGLTNGEADYIRGSLAVGCCLGIPWYVDWAYDGPYGILSMVRNNVDRDGQYYETSAMYSDHTRSLYLTFAEPLLNWRSAKYPVGINLYDLKHFQSFYELPNLTLNCLGKSPRYGDSGPDIGRSYLPDPLYVSFDYRLAERLYARVSGVEDRAHFGALLSYLCAGDVEKTRASGGEVEWLVFHAATPPAPTSSPTVDFGRRMTASDILGQKGFAFLRDGQGKDAQAALLRYGPSLNHGHLDDLNLNYYALGYELTYDLGYGLGSTHTQVGWSHQTASHNLVLVDEKSQGGDSKDTGGSLQAFADLPGLKLVEASAEPTYSALGVQTYRRLLAMIGEGPDRYLVDVFRVLGGKQHDYLLHALGDQADFSGVQLGAKETGSLAGPDFSWGALQLNDGDMKGVPNRPYWNPPPGNGLGFLMEPQRGAGDGTWQATWALPDHQSFLRLTMLGQPGTEVITAWAPGILPNQPKTRYVVARRKAQEGPLSSTYVGVLEPYGLRAVGPASEADQIVRQAKATAGETRYLTDQSLVLYKATRAGDELTWPFEVNATGEYAAFLDHYVSPSYGTVQLLLDEQPLGAPVKGAASEVAPAGTLRLGRVSLSQGSHTAALRLVGDDGKGNYWFGLRSLRFTPVGQEESVQPRPFLEQVLPLTCDDTSGSVKPAGLKVLLADTPGAYDLIASAADADRLRTFSDADSSLSLQGRFAHVRRTKDAETIHLLGASQLRLGEIEVVCGQAAYAGELRRVDDTQAVVDTSVKLPTDGRLNGQMILFDNPLYSRNTAHRIARVEPLPDGSRIFLTSPTLALGTGLVDDDPTSDTEVTSLVCNDYARGVGRQGTRYFAGKLLKGEGFETRIVATQYAQPMVYDVESTRGMSAGATFTVMDLQPGDSFLIPTTATLTRRPDGSYSIQATTSVVLKQAGKVLASKE